MAEKLQIQIGLDGGTEVQRQLENIGQTGEEAFKQIEGAASEVDFQKIADASTDAAEQIQKLIEALNQSIESFNNATEAANQLAEAHSNLTLESVKTAAEIAKLAEEIGIKAVEAYEIHKIASEGLGKSLATLASHAYTAGRALILLTPEIGGAALATGGTALAIVGLGLALEAIAVAAEKAAGPWEKLSTSLKTLSQDTGISFDALQRGRDTFEQLGISGEKFAETIRKIAEATKDLDVGEALQASADKAADANRKALDAEKNLLQIQLDRGKAVNEIANLTRIAQIEAIQNANKQVEAEKQLSEARKAAAKEAEQSLSEVLDMVEAVEDGIKGIDLSGIDPKKLLEAFNLSLKEAAENGEIASNVLLQFISRAERAQAIQIGKAFGLSTEDVDRIRTLNGVLASTDEIIRRIQSAGVPISPEAQKAFDDMRTQIDASNQAWARLEQAWRTSIFAEIGAKISSTLRGLKNDIINLAAVILEAFSLENLASKLDQTLNTIKGLWFSAWEAMANAAALVLEKVGATETAAGLRQVADSFHKSIEDAANAIADAQEKAAGNQNQLIARLRETKNATDDLTASAKKLSDKEQEIADKIGKIQSKGLEQLSDAAKKAADSIAAIDQRISDLQRRITEQGIQKGIIDPFTGGPVAGSEEAFDKLQQDRLRQVRELEDQKKKVAEDEAAREAQITEQVRQQVDAELQKLGVIKQQNEELARLARLQVPPSVPKPTGEAIPRAGETAAEFRARTGGEVGAPTPSIDLGDIGSKIADAFSTALNSVDFKSIFEKIFQPSIDSLGVFSGALEDVSQGMLVLTDQMADLVRRISQPALGPPPTEGAAAGGGLIGGRGTGTSDSNLIWASRGEFVMRYDAVRKWGVSFMEAINSGLDPFRFNLGGQIPRFATGGLVGLQATTSNVTIQFPGLPPITGLRATTDTIAELQRAAAMAQVRSGGRKPSRYS